MQKAARFHGNQDLRIDSVEIPPVAAGEVRVKIAFAGICGSDLHEYFGGPMTCRAAGCPHPLTGETVPATLGHEFSGTITEVGEDVDENKLRVGSRVCIEPIISCLECRSCLAGNRPLCEKGIGFFGYNRPGGLASYANITQANCHVVPDSVPLDVAALAEPLSVAWHAVRVSGFKEGEAALVVGAGPIGAMVTRVLKARGASWIGVSEPTETRARIAQTCGADAVFNPMKVDVVEEVRKATGGGVHVAIDCAGNQRTFDACINSTRAKGKIVMVALWEKPAQIDLQAILFGEKIVTASCCFEGQDMKETLEALESGLVKVDDLITSKIKLEDVVAKGLLALKTEEHHVKILVDMSYS
ncbi:hypothetical protein P7C70_g5852, partial [Phenoliferia sp. Uapishka_3]